MRIAYISEADPGDRAAFSGSSYQILQIMQGTGADVEVIGPVMKKWRFNAMRIASLPYRLTGRGVAWPKHPFLLRDYGRITDSVVKRLQPDVVFSPGSNAIAYSSFLRPTLFWSDAPFGALMDYYPWPQYQRLTEASRQYGLEADTRALRNAYAGIFRSSWGRDCAIDIHGADPDRVHVLPLPGSFKPWTMPDIQKAVPERLKSPWKIFFSGVDWQRKGGDRAVAIINELVRLGQPCELHVAGVTPPAHAMAGAQFPIRVLGRQNINIPVERERLANWLHQSTFLLVPTTAEALGLVFCEALGAGVPALGTHTGGVPDAIVDGKTGFLIEQNERPQVTAQRMLDAGRPEIYSRMTEASWQEWSARFSTEAIAAKLLRLLEAAAASQRVKK